MNFIERITHTKKEEIKYRSDRFPIAYLLDQKFFHAPTVSMSDYIRRPDKSGIIAEFKRASPSHKHLAPYADIERTSIGYMQAGASGLSILTDEKGFNGSLKELVIARTYNYCPILRKDFILSPYQVYESRAYGADVVLLIASFLSPTEIEELTALAKELNLEVLLEVHSIQELERSYNGKQELVGFNARNLDDFTVDLRRTLEAGSDLPKGAIKIAESGISGLEDLLNLREVGYEGYLIGTQFMRYARPEQACRRLIQEFHQHTKRSYEKIEA